MKKALKTVISLLLVLSCLCSTGCSLIKTDDAKIESLARAYLCEKYGANEDEFELVQYQSSHIAWLETGELLEKPVYVDYSFEYIYNGRNFFVIRDKWQFYDDYQMEDVEEWCTKWLQDNVCKDFVGFRLTTEEIAYYEKMFDSSEITENGAERFLNTYICDDDFFCELYFYDPFWNEETDRSQRLDYQNNYYDNLCSLLNNKFNFIYKYRCFYRENSYETHCYYIDSEQWNRYLVFDD